MPVVPETTAIPPRADPQEVAEMARRAGTNPLVQAVLEAAEGFVLVLSEGRHLLACNAELRKALGEVESVIGLRPGEALGCVHAGDGADGCGTASACVACGVAKAIQAACAGGPAAEGECSLQVRLDGRLAELDFRARASVIQLGCHALTVVVLQDISARHRQERLEALLLRDLPRTLQNLLDWSERIADGAADPRRAARRIVERSERIHREVVQLRILQQAERGTLSVLPEPLGLACVLEELRDRFLLAAPGESVRLAVAAPARDLTCCADRELLQQALQGLACCALAASAGARVTIRAKVMADGAAFQVSWPAVLPQPVASRIFHRKPEAEGGLGAYGARLLVENHLGGRLDFRSSPETGSVFTLSLRPGR